MKFNLVSLLPLLPGGLALPTTQPPSLVLRQTAQEITDQLLFSVTLPEFVSRRNARDPSTLDWTSDGCSDSPDNPFGFPFLPACYRHDFGYNNYRIQARFTKSAKKSIDDNFKNDLYYQCATTSAKSICDALADVYYAAVRAFGGRDATPGKRAEETQEELIAEYEAKLAIYEKLVQEAKEKGELPPVVQ